MHRLRLRLAAATAQVSSAVDDCNSTTVLGKAKCVLDVAQAVKSVDGAVKGIEAATTDCKSNSTQF